MRFRIEQRLASPPDAVQAALLDPAFLARLAELPKLGSPVVLERRGTDPATLRVRYAFVGEVGSAVRRVVDPDRLSWVEESTVDVAARRTTFRIVPDHYAALLSARGTITVSPAADGGSVRVAEGELAVRVPLVGGKVERAIVSGMEEHAAAEAAVLDEWIAAHDGG